jgi:hypothetical protein
VTARDFRVFTGQVSATRQRDRAGRHGGVQTEAAGRVQAGLLRNGGVQYLLDRGGAGKG